MTTATVSPAGFSMMAANLRDIIKRTAYAMSLRESRMTLNGIYLELKPLSVNFVATDGQRMAVHAFPGEWGPEGDIIISAKDMKRVLTWLNGHGNRIDVAIKEGVVSFTDGYREDRLEVRGVDGQYPNYDQVVKSTDRNDKTALFCVAELKKAVKATLVPTRMKRDNPARANLRMTRFIFKDGAIYVKAENGTATFAEFCTTNYAGPKLILFLNADYVLDMLDNIGSHEGKITMGDSLDAVKITEAENPTGVHLIMPTRFPKTTQKQEGN